MRCPPPSLHRMDPGPRWLAAGLRPPPLRRRRQSSAAVPQPQRLLLCAEQRLQAEVGRRVVNISKEIFEAAGVPVPPGYVKVKAGGLRRVFKEVAR